MRHLQSFRYVKAIVDTGSIRGASETLAISPSALNRHIQSLELDLGIKLFKRLTRGVRLTVEGEIFYEYALRQLAGFARVESQISNMKGQRVGSLKLGISEDMHPAFLHDLIGRFQRELNSVDVTVLPVKQENLFGSLRNGDIDLAIFVNPTLRKGIRVSHARDIALTAFLPNGIPIASSERLRMYELENIRLALPPEGTEIYRRIHAAIEKNGVKSLANYVGPHVLEHLEHSHLPVVGILAVPEVASGKLRLPGYKRIELDPREIGTCNISLLSSEERGLTPLSFKFQELSSELFQ